MGGGSQMGCHEGPGRLHMLGSIAGWFCRLMMWVSI